MLGKKLVRLRTKYGKKRLALIVLPVALLLLAGGSVYAALGGVGRPATSSDISLQKGLVGWWKMDGNAKDSTPYGNDGTITGASLTADRKAKATSAYSYNGTTANIEAANAAKLNLTGDVTVSAWIKPGTASQNNNARVVSKYDGTTANYILGYDTTGHMRMIVDGTARATATSAAVLTSTTTWYHVVGVRSGTTVSLYINGTLDGTASISGTTQTNSQNLAIGGGVNSTTNPRYNGVVDDVRVYNRALSTAEITALYGQYDSGINAASGESGLLGWWKLNGNAKDATPRANDGTVTAATLTTDRKAATNSAYSFDGTSALISAGNPSSLNLSPATFTWSAWIYPTNVSKDQMFLSKQSANYFRINGSKLFASLNINGAQKTKAASTTLVNNTWYHVAVTYDGSAMTIYLNGVQDGQLTVLSGNERFNTGSFEIGRWTSADPRFFVGSMSDVRVYSRALSASELFSQYQSYNSQINLNSSPTSSPTANLYAGLVGLWPLNGNTKDATPYSNNGVNSAATLTTDRKGRASSAYSFDGTTSKITVPSSASLTITGNLSISAWVNVTNNGNYQPIIAKGATKEYEFAADFRTGLTNLRLVTSGGTEIATGFFTGFTGSWVHITVVTNGTNDLFYRNGTLFATTLYSSASSSANSVTIGNRGSFYFQGTLDDLHVWNRALSATEITSLYNSYR